MYAVTASGCRDAWAEEIVWLDDAVGVVLRDGVAVAAVVPLLFLRKLRELTDGELSGGKRAPSGFPGGTGGTDGPHREGEFSTDFNIAFDTVLASVRPDLHPKFKRACLRSRVRGDRE